MEIHNIVYDFRRRGCFGGLGGKNPKTNKKIMALWEKEKKNEYLKKKCERKHQS